jgi:hypothetical protein
MEDLEFLGTHPMLPSLDLGRTVAFYEQSLGFKRTLLNEEVAVLKRDRIELHFWKCEDEALPANSGCRIRVQGIERLHQQCRSLPVDVGDLEGDAAYQVFPMNDPDGNILWIFQLEGLPPWERKR